VPTKWGAGAAGERGAGEGAGYQSKRALNRALAPRVPAVCPTKRTSWERRQGARPPRPAIGRAARRSERGRPRTNIGKPLPNTKLPRSNAKLRQPNTTLRFRTRATASRLPKRPSAGSEAGAERSIRVPRVRKRGFCVREGLPCVRSRVPYVRSGLFVFGRATRASRQGTFVFPLHLFVFATGRRRPGARRRLRARSASRRRSSARRPGWWSSRDRRAARGRGAPPRTARGRPRARRP
jgi:hypothetical protein